MRARADSRSIFGPDFDELAGALQRAYEAGLAAREAKAPQTVAAFEESQRACSAGEAKCSPDCKLFGCDQPGWRHPDEDADCPGAQRPRDTEGGR